MAAGVVMKTASLITNSACFPSHMGLLVGVLAIAEASAACTAVIARR